jgi:hypothetical protein
MIRTTASLPPTRTLAAQPRRAGAAPVHEQEREARRSKSEWCSSCEQEREARGSMSEWSSSCDQEREARGSMSEWSFIDEREREKRSMSEKDTELLSESIFEQPSYQPN